MESRMCVCVCSCTCMHLNICTFHGFINQDLPVQLDEWFSSCLYIRKYDNYDKTLCNFFILYLSNN